MTKLAGLFSAFSALVFGALFPASLAAQGFAQDYMHADSQERSGYRTVATQSWIEEWDPVQGRWVRVEDDADAPHNAELPTVVTTIVDGRELTEVRNAARYAQRAPAKPQAMALAQYGPFLVTSPNAATMVGSTNSQSPRNFDAMLRDFPGIQTLEMVEAPGTSNDIANLAVGRKIRSAGIATYVPRGGSVRSGAVELFLAGETRTIADGAQFAVHSWLDNHGREANEFAPGHPAHRLYLDYYVAMGLSKTQAQSFYAMTNSVPHADALWLNADEMRGWIAPQLSEDAMGKSDRFAARQMDGGQRAVVCTFCAKVEASLAVTQKLIAETALEAPALATPAATPAATIAAPMVAEATPRIGYANVSALTLVSL